MLRTLSPRRFLAFSLTLLVAAWTNLDLAAFHARRSGDAATFAAPRAAQVASAQAAPSARTAHDASHLCAFAAVAHTTHTAALVATPAPLVASERLALLALPARPIPGRTASGLAPPA